MIIEGGSRSAGWWWARHLQSTEKNEQVELVEVSGLDSATIPELFRELYALSRCDPNCTNFFYQHNIDPLKDERLSDAQWSEAHELLRGNLGLEGQPGFRVRHTKRDPETGQISIHEHGITLRIDLERMRAIPDSLTARIHEATSRQLEDRYDLARGRSVLVADREEPRPPRRPKKPEQFRGAESGVDPAELGKQLAAIKQRSDNGRSFTAAVDAAGYIIARGDGRDFVVIDPASDVHSLARRLGIKVAEVRAFMKDVDPASLPSVTEAKAQQRARQAEREHNQRQVDSSPPHLEHRSDAGTDELGRRKHRRPESEDMDDDIASKQRQERQAAEDREVTTYFEMVAERNRADRYIQEWQRGHDYGERHKRSLQEAQWKREAESDITDVRARALIAAGESRDFVQAVRREGAMITEEHADLQRQIALEKDPDKKHSLELKRDIQHADYMALANERIAAMSNLNSDQYKEALRQQEAWSNTGTELRKNRLELQEQMADREMQNINEAVERMNTADRQRAEFRADIRGQADAQPEAEKKDDRHAPGAAQEAVETREATAAASVTGQPERPARAPRRPANDRQETAREAPGTREATAAPSAPGTANLRTSSREIEREGESTREKTDAQQREGDTAEHAEMTDPKAAKKAALARNRSATEQSIQQGQERGYENSR